MINNLMLSAIKFSIKEQSAIISHMDFTFSNAITPPSIDNVLISLYNDYTETFENYALNNIKLYKVISSTLSSCTVKINPGYELSSTDNIEVNILNTSIFISLKNILIDGTSIKGTPVKLPGTAGDYRLVFTGINEKDISDKNIYSDIIRIISPIDTGDIPSRQVAFHRLSGDLSVSIINAEDHDSNPVSADFITILEIQIHQ